MSASIIKPELVERQWAPLCKICGSKLDSENIHKDNSILRLKTIYGVCFFKCEYLPYLLKRSQKLTKAFI